METLKENMKKASPWLIVYIIYMIFAEITYLVFLHKQHKVFDAWLNGEKHDKDEEKPEKLDE